MSQKILALIAIYISSFAVLAQQPKVSNTSFHVEPIGGTLTATVERFRQSNQSIWIGYEVPALPQAHLPSCSDWSDGSQMEDGCCGEYRLEDDNHSVSNRKNTSTPQNIYILYRFDHGELMKVRPVMAGCHLNAGGVDFTWLTGVRQEESVAFLAQLVTHAPENNRSRLLDETLLSIGFHETPEATKALMQIASSDAPFHAREQAAFWLGVQRGHEGYVALKALEEKTQDSGLREKLPFDFSQNSDPAAEDELLHMAKFDADTKVREQAIFWIAQKASKKAAAAITDAIQNDPETAVKKKAVFALSQLPKEEGVPQLIHVADTNTNPVVRKEAIFWLGQSNDPRALSYFEQILKR